MKIIVKSIPENWEKENDGRKPNTVRHLDGADVIEVVNTETGEKFEEVITDIRNWKGMIIISWKTGTPAKKERTAPVARRRSGGQETRGAGHERK